MNQISYLALNLMLNEANKIIKTAFKNWNDFKYVLLNAKENTLHLPELSHDPSEKKNG